MKKVLMMVVVAMMTAMSMSLTSCAEQEEGESNEDWILRNVINGAAWHVDMIQNSDGSWVRWEDAALFYFTVKFSASKHNFKAEKFYYKNGVTDESTREKYDENDNTLYAIKDAKIIEGMVDGKNFFRITLHKEVSSVMECSLYLYKENKTYEVKMTR